MPLTPGPGKASQTRRRPSPRGVHALPAALVCFLLALFFRGDDARDRGEEPKIAPPPMVSGPSVNPWRAAARLVEEDRGEPMGRAASVRVPAPLQHYADRRRFLAIQVAAWREQEFELPHDDAGLVELIRRGELVEVPPLGDDYILYGVGANASEDPLQHYDVPTGAEIPLYPRYDLFEDDALAWAAEAEERRTEAQALEAERKKVPPKERRRRTALREQIRRAREEAAALNRKRARIASWYRDYDRRVLLVNEWRLLHVQAASFGDRRYDLESPRDRRAFRGRLLSFLRPSARDRLLEIAAAYRAQFGRPLPVTSLVRSEEYQLHLGETNPNATRIAAPPHTTGLAFDIYYRYMTAKEQDALMGLIAGLESAGRLEALRENRDHLHLFAFADGQRPSEALIADSRELATPGAAARPASVRKTAARIRPIGMSRSAGRRSVALKPRTGGPDRRTSAPVPRTKRPSRSGTRGGSR